MVREPDQWDDDREADGHIPDQQMDLMIREVLPSPESLHRMAGAPNSFI